LSATETLVNFTVGLRYEDLPAEVVEKAKLCLLDSLGCGLAGRRTRLGRVIVEHVKETGGARQATLIGDRTKVPCAQAAFANSAMINALDYDETFENHGHPGSSLIPAALSVGEHLRVSGRELIEAMVAGYEISTRIGAAIQPSRGRMSEVWFCGTWHTFGPAAAAGKLLRLDSLQMANAFGIAGATSPIPTGGPGGWGPRPQTWVKEPTAWPAYEGVLAAQLAKRGFKGNRIILDGKLGFWRMAGSDQCDFDAMVKGLGSIYRILDISFKPYSSCRWTHSTLDAVKELAESNKLAPERIREVVVRTFPQHITDLTDYEPATLVDGEMSTPYTVAMVLLGIKPGPDWFSDRTLRDPKALSLAKKVKIEVDDEATRIFVKDRKMVSTVQISIDDGQRLTARKEYAKGDPKNPMTKDELLEKFRTLAKQTLTASKTEKLACAIEGIETTGNISSLALRFH
jgi:2-methylcitrate dehydratase PrpD